MTVHKAKGKQFDGVIVLRRETHNGQSIGFKFRLARRQAALSPQSKDSHGCSDASESAHDDGATGLAVMPHHGCP